MHSIHEKGYSYYGEVRLGNRLFILAPILLGNWPHMFGKVIKKSIIKKSSKKCHRKQYYIKVQKPSYTKINDP